MKKQLTIVMIMLLVLGTVAWGDAASDAQNKLLAKRAAEADCYRKLTERIMGLRINSETLVRDFVTESDTIETEVNSFIKGIRMGKPRWFDDGTCEIKGEVTYKKVIATLQTIHSKHTKDDRIKQSDFTKMTTRTEKSIIKAVGMGAPRPDQPLQQPDGTVDVPITGESPRHVPSIWKIVMPQGRFMAMRAARMDAYRKLAERLRGFKLSSSTFVRDFVAESDEISTELNTTLRGAKEVKTYFHDDELICEVTMEIPWSKLIATIRKSYSLHVKDDRVRESDFQEITTRVEKKYYRATGMGVPPSKYMKKTTTTSRPWEPDWRSKEIRAVGEAPIMKKENAAQAKLMAARAAELVAKRKLGEIIDGFTIQSKTTVKDFVAEHDQIATQMRTVISGSYIAKTEFHADTVEVTVVLPAMHIWSVIADEQRIR